MKKVKSVFLLLIIVLLSSCQVISDDNDISTISSEINTQSNTDIENKYDTVFVGPRHEIVLDWTEDTYSSILTLNNRDILYYDAKYVEGQGRLSTLAYCTYNVDTKKKVEMNQLEHVGDFSFSYALINDCFYYSPEIYYFDNLSDEASQTGLVEIDMKNQKTHVLYGKETQIPFEDVSKINENSILTSGCTFEDDVVYTYASIYNIEEDASYEILNEAFDQKKGSGKKLNCSTSANGKVYSYITEYDNKEIKDTYIGVYNLEGNLLNELHNEDIFGGANQLRVWKDYLLIEYLADNTPHNNTLWKIEDNSLKAVFNDPNLNRFFEGTMSWDNIDESFPYVYIINRYNGILEDNDLLVWDIRTDEIRTLEFDFSSVLL